jgi:hypothetical protein
MIVDEHSNEFDELKLLKGTDNIIACFLASPQQSVRQPYLPIVLQLIFLLASVIQLYVDRS